MRKNIQNLLKGKLQNITFFQRWEYLRPFGSKRTKFERGNSAKQMLISPFCSDKCCTIVDRRIHFVEIYSQIQHVFFDYVKVYSVFNSSVVVIFHIFKRKWLALLEECPSVLFQCHNNSFFFIRIRIFKCHLRIWTMFVCDRKVDVFTFQYVVNRITSS